MWKLKWVPRIKITIKITIKTVLIGVVLGFIGKALAVEQPYLIDIWQMEHGLPENIVNAIAQTPDGYLWCGTTHGLARFDGVQFKIFNGHNTPELGSSRIRQLFVDRRGTLWISVFEGRVVRLYAGQFTAFIPPPRESTARTVIRMAADDVGALWLTVEDGAIFRLLDGKFELVSKTWQPAGRTVFQVYDYPLGPPWVASATNIARLAYGKLVTALTGKSGLYEFLCPSRSGGAWIQTEGRVRLWQAGKWIADAGAWVPPERRVETCLEDRNGNLWVASLGKGVFRYSTNNPPLQITALEGLGSDLVRALFEDTEGNLWAGTRAGGLNRLRPALFTSYGRKDGLASDLVTAVCEAPDGALWVGTDGEGADRLPLPQGDIQHFSKDQGLTGGHVRSLLWDRQNQFWTGSWPGGLFRFETNRFIPMRDFPGRDMGLASLFEDSKSRLWLGQRTLNRLVRFENGQTVAIDLPNPEPALDVTAIAEDHGGAIWIGSDGSGLFRWQDGRSQRFTKADGLSSETIRAFLAQPDGSLWIGTVDGGLCRLKTGKFVACTSRDGLVDDVINCIIDDGRGFIWCSSFKGVFRVKQSELNDFADGKRPRIRCEAYGRSDGLPALECPGGFQPAGCKTRDGRLWFPTIKGLVMVNPADAPTNLVAPPVLIEESLVDGESLAAPAKNSSVSTVRPGQHRYEFRFAALNFSAPERVQFRHKLEGLEEQWVEAGSQRSVTYSHLSPGDYHFRVTACNQAGIWNEKFADVAFRVLPHFWQTWWFIAGMVLTAGSGLGGSVFYMTRRKLKRELERVEMQLSVERERARIAQDIHDGVGANLTEIAWLAEVAEHEAGRPEEVRAQTRKISSTARETVQSFDEIVWAVLPENDTLKSLVEYLGRRVDELFDSTPTRCWFSSPPKLPDIVVPAEVRHSFYLACKEALHNVNKHAHATEVRVQVSFEGNTLRVDIEDNGCGFDPSIDHPEGNGLRNMRQRFHDLGGQIELQSSSGKGAKISMTLPLVKPRAPK